MVTLASGSRSYPLRITETRDATFKSIEARSIEPFGFDALPTPQRRRNFDVVTVYGPTSAFFLDLPLLRGDEAAQIGLRHRQCRSLAGGHRRLPLAILERL